MFLKSPKMRGFEYKPRFYKPEEMEEEESRIKFRRLTERKPAPRKSVVGSLIVIVILAFLVRYLIQLSDSAKENQPMQEIKLEVIE